MIIVGKQTSKCPDFISQQEKGVRVVIISASEGEFGSVREACRALGEKDVYVLGGQNI